MQSENQGSQDCRSYDHAVVKAVIPAAGVGSRMLSLSRNQPKELIPIAGKPMIWHVLTEAIDSGIERICIVLSRQKEIIREYVASVQWPQSKRAGQGDRLPSRLEVTFTYQPDQLGLGDALLQARDFVGSDSFVMMIPDQLMLGSKPVTAQLLEAWQSGPIIWSSLLRLPKEERIFFPGARGVKYEEYKPGVVRVERLLSESETQRMNAGRTYEVRGFGRTIFPPQIFDYLGADFINPESGEVDLLKTFQACTGHLSNFGVWLAGEPFDFGTFAGYQHYGPRFAALSAQSALVQDHT